MTIKELFDAAGLTPQRPIPWRGDLDEQSGGVYVVELLKCMETCPFIPELSELIDEPKRLSEIERWVPGERIIYIGQTSKQSLSERIQQFYRHKYGRRSPHRGGQSVHLLKCELLIHWLPSVNPEWAESMMICAFIKQVGRLPYANLKLPSIPCPDTELSSPHVRQRERQDLEVASARSRSLAIVNIGQLVTLAGPKRSRIGMELRDLRLINDAAMLIEDGRIAAVGTNAELSSCIASDAIMIDAEGRCVTPGFVDAHTHLVFAGNRADEFEKRIAGATYQEIAAAGGGILRTVKLTRAASEDDLLAAARRHRDWMLRGGTTTLEAKSGYGLDRDTELKMLRVLRRLNAEGPARIVPTLLAAHTVPPEFADRRSEYVRWIAEDLIPEVAVAGLARNCDAFCDDHAFTVDEARIVLSAAKQHGLGIRVHAEQFRPGTGAALAAELGAATADHVETASDAILMQLRDAGVQPVLLPGSVFALGRTQYPSARKMVELGLAVVLATDFNPGSSPVASMPFILSLASVQMGLLPAEALSAATINAAYSLGLGDQIGSLEPGKQADFLIHEFRSYRELAYFIAAPLRPRVFLFGREAVV